MHHFEHAPHPQSRERLTGVARVAAVLIVALVALVLGAASPARAAGCVQLQPSADVAKTINRAATGTEFCFAPGVYRLSQTIKPKSGMVLHGVPGAVLSGAKPVTSWAKSGATWVASGQTQAPTLNHGAPGDTMQNPQAQYNENVYYDGKPLWKVGVKIGGRTIGEPRATVGTGEYFFDYDADKVYLGSDPTGHRVDAAVIPVGISSSATGVTVSGLTVEMTSGIGIRAIGPWTVEKNEVRLNAHKGVVAQAGTRVIGNTIHHNGAYGITGEGANLVVEGNEISFNNVSRLENTSGNCNASGGSKFYHTTGAVIRGNDFHDNYCNGIWLDINNYNSLVEGNRSVDNLGHGITFEISYNAVIRDNEVGGNDGWGVLVRDSPNVEIYGNKIDRNSAGPVMLFNRGRTDHPSSYGPHVTKNVQVYKNTMVVPNASSVKLGAVDMAGGAMFRSGVRYYDNTYTLESATTKAFKWNGQSLTMSQWRAAGQDTNGRFTVVPPR